MSEAYVPRTAKELKVHFKKIFCKDGESLAKYYPAAVLSKYGFEFHTCDKCQSVFYRHKDSHPFGEHGEELCGDSDCLGSYRFIHDDHTKEQDGQWSVASLWENFRDTFESKLDSGIRHTAIPRYPVVARWRNDVDFVAAGIFCFQPFCVSGEVPPPANPLICAQPCFRFNDLDSVGLTGRHYSCFHMIGVQVFNYPGQNIQGREKYFKEEIIDNFLDWIINKLHISTDRITLKPDVWAGGGNLGACMECFIDGLEIGNMVFMQYAVVPNYEKGEDELRELDVQVIDTGLGLERIPWLLNGSVTSYLIAFNEARHVLQNATSISDEELQSGIWRKFAPYSCLLNADENDMMASWRQIAEICGITEHEAREQAGRARDLYGLLDHTRTVLIAIQDGCLPSNTGGGSNIRLVLRSAFQIMQNRDWFIGESGREGRLTLLREVCRAHRKDLEQLHGPNSFPEPSSFNSVIEIEYDRWATTAGKARSVVESYLRRKPKDYVLTDEDWIQLVTSDGIAAADVAHYGSTPERQITVPDDLNTIIATYRERQQSRNRAQTAVGLFTEQELGEVQTDSSSMYDDWRSLSTQGRDAKITSIITHQFNDNAARTGVVFDKCCLYPTAGGQDCDHGAVTVAGITIPVIDVIKTPHHVVAVLKEPLPESVKVGDTAHITVDGPRRRQLMQHHSGTHILCSAARAVLGPHVWQAGAHKAEEMAHLDITHYDSLTREQMREIEDKANAIIADGHEFIIANMPKDEAEKKYGFSLYQGGVVPGKTVRVVRVGDAGLDCPIDAEACCGTHVHNTGDIGFVRILRSSRISDGVVRIEFVAGARAREFTAHQSEILDGLMRSWGVDLDDVSATATRFFNESKLYKSRAQALAKELLMTQIREACHAEGQRSLIAVDAEQRDAQAAIQSAAGDVRAAKKEVVVVGPGYVLAVLSGSSVAGLQAAMEEFRAKGVTVVVPKADKKGEFQMAIRVGKKKVMVDDAAYVQLYSTDNGMLADMRKMFESAGFVHLE